MNLTDGGVVVVLVVALAVLSAVSTAAAIVFYRRSRRSPGITPQALNRLLRASWGLREGGLEWTVDRVAGQLHSLLDCVAVGIAEGQGVLLAWEGAAHHHYVDFAYPIELACRKNKRTLVTHDNLPSSECDSCEMSVATIMPVVIDGKTALVLIVVDKNRAWHRTVMIDAMERVIRNHLELSRLKEAKSAQSKAEVKALRAQISPHFLYNALTTITTLIRRDPEHAEDLLLDFAEYTRYAFRAGSFTTLAEEMRNIDRYLTIESTVYAGRLGVRLKIAPAVLSVPLPFLILQPLVENAVRHGLAQKPGGGTVTITAADSGTEALISVEDDGVGMDPGKLADLNHTDSHVGIRNVNERLQMIFGHEYALAIETAEGSGMKVILRVPKFPLRVLE